MTSRERNPQFCGSPARFRDRGFYSIQPDELTCTETEVELGNIPFGVDDILPPSNNQNSPTLAPKIVPSGSNNNSQASASNIIDTIVSSSSTGAPSPTPSTTGATAAASPSTSSSVPTTASSSTAAETTSIKTVCSIKINSIKQTPVCWDPCQTFNPFGIPLNCLFQYRQKPRPPRQRQPNPLQRKHPAILPNNPSSQRINQHPVLVLPPQQPSHNRNRVTPTPSNRLRGAKTPAAAAVVEAHQLMAHHTNSNALPWFWASHPNGERVLMTPMRFK